MSNESTVIHSQLVATQTRNLLLPNTAIAEIVRYTEPQPADDAPDWLLGTMVWRGLRIPVGLIVRHIAQGQTVAEVIREYPELEPEDVRQALLYAAWVASGRGEAFTVQ